MSNPTFSYAQAAKSRPLSQLGTQPPVAPAAPSTNSQGREDMATFIATKPTPTPAPTPVDTNHIEPSSSPQTDVETTQIQTNGVSRDEPNTAASNPADSAPGIGNRETSAMEDTTKSGDESQSADSAERVDTAEARKTFKLKRSSTAGDTGTEPAPSVDEDAEKEQSPPPAPKPVLTEARIPSVNFWQQRIEANAAKAKFATTASGPVTGPNAEDTKQTKSGTETKPHEPAESVPVVESSQKKTSEASRPSDLPPKRNGSRGSRLSEKGDKGSGEPLASVTDATAWPTPDSAAIVDEVKHKSQDKVDRADNQALEEIAPTKRHKDKWVTIPYVPTVNFQTPLPTRGGRPVRGGSRGGRDAGSRGQGSGAGSASARGTSPPKDEGASAGFTTTTKGGETRSRESDGTQTRATSLPPTATKRASVDGSFNREQRKPSAPSGAERARDAAPETAKNASHLASGRDESTKPRTEGALSNGDSFSPRHSQSERRVNSVPQTSDYGKDKGFAAFKESAHAARERGESRADRGRGGHRGGGRGIAGPSNNNSLPPHTTPSTFIPSHGLPLSATARQNGPYSPSNAQMPFAQQMILPPTTQQRTTPIRGNSRLPPTNGLGRGLPGPKINTPPAASTGYYQPSPAEFSPIPYTELWTSGLIPIIKLQVEYYLSVDNLCKDRYLRQHMDSQGFVPLTFIAGFKRMRELAQTLEPIRIACENSDIIDYVVGFDDGIERLRPRDKWDRFVLSPNERVEEARNEGPSRFHWRSNHGLPQATYGPAMVPPAYPATSPTAFPPVPGYAGEEEVYAQYPNGGHYEPSVERSEMNGQAYPSGTPLSATVPDFSPNPAAMPAPALESATVFTDQQAESLTLLFASGGKDAKVSAARGDVPPPVANGTAAPNGPHAAEPLSPTFQGTNGTHVGLGLMNDASSFTGDASPRTEALSATGLSLFSDVAWTDEQKSVAAPVQEPTKGEPYPVFRMRALEARLSARPGETPKDMKSLYDFWSHFLPNHFNARMYDEFRTYAIEDAAGEIPNRTGLSRLVAYYEGVLLGKVEHPSGLEQPRVVEVLMRHFSEAQRLNGVGSSPINGGPYSIAMPLTP